MNFNVIDNDLPFKFNSLVSISGENIEFKISIEFNDLNEYSVESYSESSFNRWRISSHNNSLLFDCDLSENYFFRIRKNNTDNLYYGFYGFNVDDIPDHLKQYYIDISHQYKHGLSLFINHKIKKHNYSNFENMMYEFTPNKDLEQIDKDTQSDKVVESENFEDSDHKGSSDNHKDTENQNKWVKECLKYYNNDDSESSDDDKVD